MARILFGRTHDRIAVGVLVGASAGATLVAFALYASYNPGLAVLGASFLVPFALILAVRLPSVLYKASCSACTADLTRFCRSRTDTRLSHCPFCGATFETATSSGDTC